MLDYRELFSLTPFSISQKKKERWYLKKQIKLNNHHYKNCKEFKAITDKIFHKKKLRNLSDLPFVHSNIFKNFNLKSIKQNDLSKTLTSSGTRGSLSKINLDKKTSLLQSKALMNIFSNILEPKKLKFFFVESSEITKSQSSYSARIAAVKGFTQLAKNVSFLLNKKSKIQTKELIRFIKNNPDKEFIIFGFTSFVWSELINKLRNKKYKIPKNNGILIHGGGWKKLENQNIGRDRFYNQAKNILGVKSVYNYYGMVEQTGSVFIECEKGFFHSSVFSDILIRDQNLNNLPIKKEGLIQVLSLLPLSYPGHNILTEDLGRIEGLDNCKCGRKGKFFSIKGRVQGTELRGCSDVGY